MTEQNAIITVDQIKDIEARKAAYIPLLRELIVNGKKLSDQQIIGRAAFAAQQGLDPITEVNTMVDKDGNTMGHSMHINGYRRKCQEQVGRDSEIALEFVEMDKAKLPTGAYIGFECRMRVGADYVLWQKRLLEVGKAMREAMGTNITYQELIALVGQPPMFSGVGIVYNGELNEWKDRSFNPIERAKKRAEANARKHRFPTNTPIYDSDNGPVEVVDPLDLKFVEEKPNGNGKKSESTLLSELGFGDKPVRPAIVEEPPAPEEPPAEEITEGEFTDIEPSQAFTREDATAQPKTVKELWPADAKVTYETAATFKAAKSGKLMVDLPLDEIRKIVDLRENQRAEAPLSDNAAMQLDACYILVGILS